MTRTDDQQRLSQNKTLTPSIQRLPEEQLMINDVRFKIVENYNEGLNLDHLKERYSDIFEKYDYIVGDMSYGQMRLRGFYHNTTENVPFDMFIRTLDDYLNEHTAFGSAYFVIERLGEKKVFPEYEKPNQRRNKRRRNPSNKESNRSNKLNEQRRNNSSTSIRRGELPSRPKKVRGSQSNKQTPKSNRPQRKNQATPSSKPETPVNRQRKETKRVNFKKRPAKKVNVETEVVTEKKIQKKKSFAIKKKKPSGGDN